MLSGAVAKRPPYIYRNAREINLIRGMWMEPRQAVSICWSFGQLEGWGGGLRGKSGCV